MKPDETIRRMRRDKEHASRTANAKARTLARKRARNAKRKER